MWRRIIEIVGILLVLVLFTAVGKIVYSELEKRDVRIEDLESQIEQLEASEQSGGLETEYEVQEVEAEYTFPIAEEDFLRFTSPFGLRISPILDAEMKHQGLDIAAVWRAQVVAVADGVVVEHWPSPGTPYPGGGVYRGHEVYGGMIKVDHGDFRTVYAHLSWTRVHQGMRVQAGEVLGRVGDTGKADGAHLHFELEQDGENVNPLLYIVDPRKQPAIPP